MNDFRFSDASQLNERLKQLNSHLGGEGTVYDDHQHLAIKIFNKNEVNIGRKKQKVQRLIAQFSQVRFEDVINPLKVVTVKGHFLGYTMQYVQNAKDLDYIAEKSFLNKIDLKKCLEIMINVAQAVEKIHNLGIIIGDFHPGQILVVGKKIYFVDTDSWGWNGTDRTFAADKKCLPFYVDPLARDFSCRDVAVKSYSQANDYYSLAVIAFKVLTGEHPFGGVYQVDKKMSIEMRARNQLSVLGNHDIKLMKGKTWDIWMSDELKEAFLDIFERRKRYNIGPALFNQLMNLQYCKRHNGYYDGSYDRCPKCSKYIKATKSAAKKGQTSSGEIFIPRQRVKQLYDYRTYLNDVGEVVRVNDRGEEVRKSVKGVGKKDTNFLDNERYMVKIKPASFIKKMVGINTGSECYIYLYKDETEIYKVYVEDRTTIRIVGNSVYYVEKSTHTLKRLTIHNGNVEVSEVAQKPTDFEYNVGANSSYAIISPRKNGIEIDICGVTTLLPKQMPLIMKYDAISNMWIWVAKLHNSKYNTIVFRKGEAIYRTDNIDYSNTNLQGSVFYRATLCLPANGKMISVMPYVANMPINNVITETPPIDVINADASFEVVHINEDRSELYVLAKDRNVFRFVM